MPKTATDNNSLGALLLMLEISTIRAFLLNFLSGMIHGVQNIPFIPADSHPPSKLIGSLMSFSAGTSSNQRFFDHGNMIPKIEKKLQDIFGSTKCKVINLNTTVVIKFTYSTTDKTLADYAAILSERYEIPPKKITQESAWNSGTLEFPAKLRLALNLTELRDKLGCGQELAKYPKESEQQLAKYSPPSCRR